MKKKSGINIGLIENVKKTLKHSQRTIVNIGLATFLICSLPMEMACAASPRSPKKMGEQRKKRIGHNKRIKHAKRKNVPAKTIKPRTMNPIENPKCARTKPVAGSKPTKTRKIKNLTGPGSSAQQFGIGGTDLGIPVRQPDGKIAYIFGDTFRQNRVGGPGWRSPVLLRSEPGLNSEGIVFTGAAGGSQAKQILDYRHDGGRTWLPTDAISFGGRMYLHFAVNQGLGNVLWSQIAYSDDNGENWKVSNARWEAHEDHSLRQMWTWEHGCDGYVYVLSTKFISRDRGIILHRVPDNRLLEKNAYQPWGYKDGEWGWGHPPTPVLEGKFGEMALRRVENKWVLAWFNAAEHNISIKVFDRPTSNLETAKTYRPIKAAKWGKEDDKSVAQLYGAYIHPDSTLHNLHLIISQWNTKEGWPYRAMQFVTGIDLTKPDEKETKSKDEENSDKEDNKDKDDESDS